MRLKGKTALIAGAGRNSGKAIALTFARAGADLILVARQEKSDLDAVAQECRDLGANTLPLLADIADYPEVNRVVELALERFASVDILVSVAAIRPHKAFWNYDYDEWHRVFGVNVHSTFYLAKALAPGMISRRSGSIIALGAIASLAPLLDAAAETATKHSLYGLIKSLALELGPYGVRANLLAPSHIVNVRHNPEWYPESNGEPHTGAELARTPLRRRGLPQEVANAALFLASDESSYVTGDRILCAGGRYM